MKRTCTGLLLIAFACLFASSINAQGVGSISGSPQLKPNQSVHQSEIRSEPSTRSKHRIALNFARLAEGGVQFESQYAGTPDINAVAGDEVCFDLIAKDRSGIVIKDWNDTSKASPAVSLVFRNSTASKDTSIRSWNGKPDDYSWARITVNGVALPYDFVNDRFHVHPSAFTDGRVHICLKHTKAEKGVTLEVLEKMAYLSNQMSANMNFIAGAIANYLVELTPAVGGEADPAVYLMRLYEMIVSPRDRYLNVSNDTIITKFSARFPGEYDNQMTPGVTLLFNNDTVVGPKSYFLASRIERDGSTRERQWIRPFSAKDPAIYGQTHPYRILNHAPNQFSLISPADSSEIILTKAGNQEVFTWEKAVPQDPYTDIQISRFDPRTYSDSVKYEIRFVDGASLSHVIEFPSDNNGMDAHFTTNQGRLNDMIDQYSGDPLTKSCDVVWFVEATDGLYITQSIPNLYPKGRIGYRLTLTKGDIVEVGRSGPMPTEFQLKQNYPNPFNPTTTIGYSLPTAGRVSIMIYDILGSAVRTLVDRFQPEGSYSATWDATNDLGRPMPGGVYVVRMVSGGYAAVRTMTLLQ